ncbi:MAG: 4-aminobutyrate--2-oxoglutarate transaminase [Candidatus Sericytochromatia bacterium]|nr:4-aminobutyrate--2-oxoglutarate transaminase [Candidatus Tanganyikabacteria bacterium]
MSHIRLQTAIPGPRSREIMARRDAAVPRGPFQFNPIVLAGGEGAVVWDVDGNRYLDFGGGLGCLNIGHADPDVVAAVKAQADRYLHTCFHVNVNEPYVELAETLARLAPVPGPAKTLLVNSGAEAVENAIKIARHHTGRSAVICFDHAFHGRTYGGMTLTSKILPYKRGFGPFLPEVYRIPYATCYRCPLDLAYPACEATCAGALEQAFKTVVDAADVAAIIVEPILGEGGFYVPPPEWFHRLRETCDKHGILLIADEIQTGIGRTGYMFASEHFGLAPDLVLAAKSLAAGLPLGAVIGRAEIMDAPQVGGLGGTYGGSPIACAAALAVLGKMPGLLGRAEAIGNQVQAHFLILRERIPHIGDVRGLGAMIAIELVKHPATREPAGDEAKAVIKWCYEHGVITLSAGTHGNIIRTLMPLVMTDEQLVEGLSVYSGALEAVFGSRAAVSAG